MNDDPIRIYAAEVGSGTILWEIPIADGASFSHSLDGGTCSISVPLDTLTNRVTGELDMPIVELVLGMLTPYKRSLVAVKGTTCLGEWVITNLNTDTASPVVRVAGATWEQYPRDRVPWKAYQYSTATSIPAPIMDVAHQVLIDSLYGTHQESVKITVPPPPGPAGEFVILDVRQWEGYYDRIIADLQQQGDFEWAINVSLEWATNGLPSKAVRTVEWGQPVISRPSANVLEHHGVGTVSGNIESWKQSRSGREAVTRVAVWGSGSGDAQVVGTAYYGDLRGQGYLAVDRALSEPNATQEMANTWASQQIARSVTDLRGLPEITVRTDGLAGWPRVGDFIGVVIEPLPVMPTGYSGVVRVGEINFKVERGDASTITLRCVEEWT